MKLIDILSKTAVSSLFLIGVILFLAYAGNPSDAWARDNVVLIMALYAAGFLSIGLASLAFRRDRVLSRFRGGSSEGFGGLAYGGICLTAGFLVMAAIFMIVGMIRFSSPPETVLGFVRFAISALGMAIRGLVMIGFLHIVPFVFALSAVIAALSAQRMAASLFMAIIFVLQLVALPGAFITAVIYVTGLPMAAYGIGFIGMGFFFARAFHRLQETPREEPSI